MVDNKPADTHDVQSLKKPSAKRPPGEPDAAVSTKAEAGVIKEQAREAQRLKEGENLLPVASDSPATGKQGEE